MNKIFYKTLFCGLLMAFQQTTFSQCTTGIASAVRTVTNDGNVVISIFGAESGEYIPLDGIVAGDTYQISLYNNTPAFAYVTITETDGTTVVAHGTAPLTFTAPGGVTELRAYTHDDSDCNTGGVTGDSEQMHYDLSIVNTMITPSNDLCANAIDFSSSIGELGAFGSNLDETFVGTSWSGEGFPSPTADCTLDGYDGGDVWYKFTGVTDLTYSPEASGGSVRSVVALYTGSCGSLTQTACDEVSTNGSAGDAVFSSLNAGTCYYLRVYDENNQDDQRTTFSFALSTSGMVLPVELTSFTGKAEARGNHLSWITASEIQNEGFEVQHSANGRDFEKIGWVVGNGTTLDQQSYDFMHDGVNAGNNYYRLKQIDADGGYDYSEVINIRGENIGNVVIFPNPVKNDGPVSLQLDSEYDTNVVIEIININGQSIQRMEYFAQKGSNIIELNTADLANGMYYIHINNQAMNRNIPMILAR